MAKSLSGKVALITGMFYSVHYKLIIKLITWLSGSSSGIGEEAAIYLSSLGANVVVTGRNEERVKQVVKKCESASQKALGVVADITKDEDLKMLVKKTIDEFGKLDILVNNAGFSETTTFDAPNRMEVYDETMNTNVRGVYYLTSLAVPYLEKTRGTIVNISFNARMRVVI